MASWVACVCVEGYFFGVKPIRYAALSKAAPYTCSLNWCLWQPE